MDCFSEQFCLAPDLDISSNCNKDEVRFKFSIFQLLNQSNCIFYPEQLQPEEEPSSWQLDLNCSRSSTRTDMMRLHFTLYRRDNQMYSANTDMVVKVFNCAQHKIMEHSFNSVFTAQSKFFDYPSSFGFFMWLRSKLFTNEDLCVEIYVSIRDIAPDKIHKTHRKRLSDEHSRSVLQTDFKNAFENRNFTDVEFKGADGSVFAHKFVLCCRSSIFQKVLKEAGAAKVISMPKRSKHELDLFLEYLYTGSISTSNIDELETLNSMASDYEVLSLCNSIRDILVTRVPLGNESEILPLAIDCEYKLCPSESYARI